MSVASSIASQVTCPVCKSVLDIQTAQQPDPGVDEFYFQPDGTSGYLRPDGTSTYIRP